MGNKHTKRNLWAPEKCFSKFVCLFNCVHSNFSEILGPWWQINGEKNKTKQKLKHQVYMMWFRSPSDLPVNVVLAGKKCTLSWTNLLQQKCFFWERETIFYWTGLSFCSRFFLWCTWWLREKNSFVMIISVVVKISSPKYNSRCFFFSFFQNVFLSSSLQVVYAVAHWLWLLGLLDLLRSETYLAG